MNTLKSVRKTGLALAALSLLAGPVLAADAGSVLFARGDVTAERQPPVALQKGDTIDSNDTVVTGDASRAQLEMLDGARIAIRPNSRLRIIEYSVAASSAAPAVSTSEDSAVLDLVKGGFRTITGAIGEDDPSDYEVRTPVGVLGIRGTDYTAVFCNGDCDWVPGGTAGAPIPDGLYLGVTEGRIVFRTPLEVIELESGQYAFIPLETPEPQRLDLPPGVLLDDNALRFDAESASAAPDDQRNPDGSAGDGKTNGFNATLGTRRAPQRSSFSATTDDSDSGEPGDSGEAPKQPTIVTDPNGNLIDITPGEAPEPRGNRTIRFSTGPLGQSSLTWTSVTENEPSQYSVDGNDNLDGFAGQYPVQRQIPGDAQFDLGTASITDAGFDSMTVMRWGRWSGGDIDVSLSDGSVVNQPLGEQSLHWVAGPEGAPPVMPITGTASYSLLGSTSPTDNFGNVGTLGNASFSADFTNLRVDSTLSIDIAGSNWLAQGVGNIGSAAGLPAHLFQGIYGSVVIDGQVTGSGIFSGFFSEPGQTSIPGIPGGVGLTFSLQDAQGAIAVSGAAVFGDP